MSQNSKKISTKEVEPKNDFKDMPIALYVPNVLGYIRFGLILASWPFGLKDP
jgi:hypothetical protein